MEKRPFSMLETWLQCIGCGHKADLLQERKFKCPKCGDLFDVEHSFNFLKTFGGAKWLRRLFEKRVGLFNFKAAPWEMSGVWRYKELIMPFLPEEYIVTLGEGNVPIVRAGKNLMKWIGADIFLWLILEGMTPSGSFKDFGMTVLISLAKAAGIKKDVGASTGDTSASAACYSAAAEIDCDMVLPEGKITAIQQPQPLVHGARVILLPGSFDKGMKVVRELASDYDAFIVNSLNPSRIEGHQATSFQVGHFFYWIMPYVIAVPVGNGSDASSVGKGDRLMQRLGLVDKIPKILGCQSHAANPLAKSWEEVYDKYGKVDLDKWQEAYVPQKELGETTATAQLIGEPVSYKKVMRETVASDGWMTTSSEEDLNEAVHMAGKDGFLVCPQTGVMLAGIRNAVRKGWIQKNQTVVGVSTATGLKFMESIVQGLEKQIIHAPDCETKTVAKILGL